MPSRILPVYNPAPVQISYGKGIWLYDEGDQAWLDCVGGIATTALGHCHPVLIAALQMQSEKLWHVSNAFPISQQEQLAQRLTDACFADLAFFANSGTEAVECALKMARKYHAHAGHPERIDVVAFEGAFHGRTYAALNATGNNAYLEGFGPRLPGYVHVPIADHQAIEDAIARPTTAAIIVEPVQGEGGAKSLSHDDLRRLRDLSHKHGVLLIYDEVQCGMGRTGQLFAHQWFDGIAPDIMVLAKALGNGFPVGACLATRGAASGMQTGSHGSTFGGNPLAMAVALAAFDLIATKDMLDHVRHISSKLRDGLMRIAGSTDKVVAEVRGKGLLIGVRLKTNNREFIAAAREERLLLAGGGDNCVRLLPPLILTEAEADEILVRFERACLRVGQAIAAAEQTG